MQVDILVERLPEASQVVVNGRLVLFPFERLFEGDHSVKAGVV